MKRLVGILLVIVTVMNLGLTAFAQLNLFCPIEIIRKNAKPLPGDDPTLYYGYIDLNEEFDLDTLNYTANVNYDISNVRIKTSFKLNSGNKDYDLVVGKNVINIDVARSDNTSRTYTLTITRKQNPDDDNSLTQLDIGYGDIKTFPVFNPDVLDYFANVGSNVEKIDISYCDASGSWKSKDYPLKPGENKIEIPIVSRSGLKRVYTININREKSSYNEFSFMDIEEYDKNNVRLSTEMLEYSDDPKKLVKNVSYDASSVNIKVAYFSPNKIKITGHGLHSLKVGTNVFNITIEAENGDKKVYPVKINRLKPSAKLESLQINEYICGTEQTPFTLDVKHSVSQVNILGTAENSTAKVIGNGKYNLKVGTNKFTITVKAANGTTKKYPIVVNRLKKEKVKVLVIWTIVE